MFQAFNIILILLAHNHSQKLTGNVQNVERIYNIFTALAVKEQYTARRQSTDRKVPIIAI